MPSFALVGVPHLLSSDSVESKSLYSALKDRVWDFYDVTVRGSRPQTPEPDSPSEAESTKSAHIDNDPSLPVKGMYPLLDLITEQGSSGLGNPVFFISAIHALTRFKSIRLSSLNNLYNNSSTRYLLVLILPSQRSTSKSWTMLFSSRWESMARKKRS